MNSQFTLPEARPLSVLQDLVARHGRLSVLALAITALLRPSRRQPNLNEWDLSDHVLRDIGFSARGAPPKSWEHYR